jgi:hypothetical protein
MDNKVVLFLRKGARNFLNQKHKDEPSGVWKTMSLKLESFFLENIRTRLQFTLSLAGSSTEFLDY